MCYDLKLAGSIEGTADDLLSSDTASGIPAFADPLLLPYLRESLAFQVTALCKALFELPSF
jgi:hypothetical protein